jgi:glyoxylase-like metal-dependent hydrolase (beta-lactamase superfamily II)
MENLLTLTVNSTHFYLVDLQPGWLLVDAGWGMAQFTAQLKAYRFPITAIKYVLFTHHHPDHAGLIQAVRDACGAKLIIHKKQIPYLEDLRTYFEKKGGYVPIRVEKDDLVSPSRGRLSSIGIHGEIIETPGHSPDSISLGLDSGVAFIGDLTLPMAAGEEQIDEVCRSWRTLLARGTTRFYHSHTDPFGADRIQDQLKNICP